MELKIQSLHFDATEKLEAFIQKKLAKLEKHNAVQKADVVLKVLKPETAMNKQAGLRLQASGRELYAEKVANTFEEAVADALDALTRQLEKTKDK